MKTKFKLLPFILLALSAAPRLEAGQTPQFVTIYQFGGVNAIPGSELTLGPGGKLFGTTYGGAASDGTGSIYELVAKANGTFGFKTLYRFDISGSPPDDGQYPYAGVTLTPDGTTLYGTTQQGGTNGAGVLFSLNIAQAEANPNIRPNIPQPQFRTSSFGSYGVIHDFVSASEGGASRSALKFAIAGQILFGTLSSDGPNNGGSVFKISDTDDQFERVYIEANYANDGKNPQGKLAAGPSGRTSGSVQRTQMKPNVATNIDSSTITLYGTTRTGGSNNWGTVYKVDGDGSNYMILHNFNFSATDGAGPQGGLVLAGNALYGTTSSGGGNYSGTVFQINTDGSGFNIIGNFTYATTGSSPQGDLILSGNTLYGTTYGGGAGGGGTVYSINTNGSNFTVLHSFSSPMDDGNGNYTNSDGGWSVAGLVLSGYTLYGTTPYGGTNGVGTAYEIVLPSPPLLNIAPSGGDFIISWPSSATNFVLQQNSNLATTNWSTKSLAFSDNGTNKSVSIIPTAGNAFFRLLNTNGP